MRNRRQVPTRNIPRWLVVAAVAAVALLLVGCGEDAGDDATEGAEVDHDQPEVATAVSDAAERTGTDPADIEVVAFEQVTWPDGALGCPEPEQMYTQALVEGYRVLLQVDGTELTYHGAEGDEPFLCEDPQPPLETEG